MLPQTAETDLPVYTLPAENLEKLLRASLAAGGRLRFHARGSSMSPLIKNDDRITLAALGERLPAPGMVVVFIGQGKEPLIVHRIIGKRPGAYLLRGDNTNQPDGWIEPEAVLGCVEQVERRGRPVKFGQGPERRLIALLSRLGLLRPLLQIARQLRDLFRELWAT